MSLLRQILTGESIIAIKLSKQISELEGLVGATRERIRNSKDESAEIAQNLHVMEDKLSDQITFEVRGALEESIRDLRNEIRRNDDRINQLAAAREAMQTASNLLRDAKDHIEEEERI